MTEEEVNDSTKTEEQLDTDTDKAVTFDSFGIPEPILKAIEKMGWKEPTPVQRESLPYSMKGKDIIGLAQTGSGKTAAFAIPIISALLQTPKRFFACVLSPTRELAYQISEQFEALGTSVGLSCVVLVGGIDLAAQTIAIAKRPHIIIGTPGRVLYHLQNTRGFSLQTIKYFVLDEADRLLNMDFEEEIGSILKVLPRERHTYLYSATMTSKVAKLQRASLQDPVRIQVDTKYQTVDKLVQHYLFIPEKFKHCYLAFILTEFAGSSVIIFTIQCVTAQRIALVLRNLGFSAVPLSGKMSQTKRLGALNKFKTKDKNILVATDVASRGLDIPDVDLVINFDIPLNPKEYIHRVGRTARAGKSGRAISLVSQYDVECYQKIEAHMNTQLPQYPVEEEQVMVLLERLTEAERIANIQLKETGFGKKRKRTNSTGKDDAATGGDDDVDEEVAASSGRLKPKKKRSQKPPRKKSRH